MLRLWLALAPDLARFPEPQQGAVLERALHTAFDVVELVGLAAAVGLSAALTQYAWPGDALPHRAAALLINFAVALPLVGLLAAPFYLRRLRRGVRSQLEPGNSHE